MAPGHVCSGCCLVVLSLGGGPAGQVDSSFVRKAGPSIETSLLAKATAESPLVGRSAVHICIRTFALTVNGARN